LSLVSLAICSIHGLRDWGCVIDGWGWCWVRRIRIRLLVWGGRVCLIVRSVIFWIRGRWGNLLRWGGDDRRVFRGRIILVFDRCLGDRWYLFWVCRRRDGFFYNRVRFLMGIATILMRVFIGLILCVRMMFLSVCEYWIIYRIGREGNSICITNRGKYIGMVIYGGDRFFICWFSPLVRMV
jgi:hypothetical protein